MVNQILELIGEVLGCGNFVSKLLFGVIFLFFNFIFGHLFLLFFPEIFLKLLFEFFFKDLLLLLLLLLLLDLRVFKEVLGEKVDGVRWVCPVGHSHGLGNHKADIVALQVISVWMV